MLYPELTLSQQKILRHIARATQDDPHGTIAWGYKPNQLHIYATGENVTCNAADFRTFHLNGYIELHNQHDAGAATGAVEPLAHQAVSENFGQRKRDIVLRAIYELSEGNTGKFVTQVDAIEASGLSDREFLNAVELLEIDKLAILQQTGVAYWQGGESGEAGSPVEYSISVHGIAAVEDPSPAASASGHTFNFHNSPVANVNTGYRQQVSVAQNIDTSCELLERMASLLRELVDGLQKIAPDAADEVAADLSAAQGSATSPEPDKELITRRIKRAGQSIMDKLEIGAGKVETAEAWFRLGTYAVWMNELLSRLSRD